MLQQLNRHFFPLAILLPGLLAIAIPGYGQQTDTTGTDTTGQNLPFPLDDRSGDFYTDPTNNPIDLDDPSIIEQNITYDPVTGEFKISEQIGDAFYRNPNYISFEDFLKSENERLNEAYFEQRSEGVNLLGRNEGLELLTDPSAIDKLFGGTNVEIRPQGNIELIFGFNHQNIENPTLPERAQRQTNFDFDMNINMSVVGQIGDKMKLNTNYNTQATFDFENQVKLNYEGTEDEIVQNLEAGNVSFPLNSQLIQGSQSLFGIKSKLKFGRLTVTSVVSQQQSKRENITIQGGAQMRDFEIEADQYDENRHFFLGHYFRDNYERFLKTMPVVTSPVMITRIEVWVTNTSGYTQNTRDIVAFADLGERERISNPALVPNTGPPIPYNTANNLYQQITNTQGARSLSTAISTLQTQLGLRPITDFEKTRGRKLAPSEYTLYPQLGYISLNQQLRPDEVLGVAYEFTYQGKTYRVGEFSQDLPIDPNNQNVLFLKMLKATAARPKQPIWDLMMKNIYSLGAYQINSEDFRLDLFYQDPGGGVKRYIPEGEGIKSRPILQVLNLDRLNNQLDPMPDGIFDFVPGITINPENGRLIFPVVEPFGDFLRQEFITNGNSSNLAEKYTYQVLYDSTKFIAQQFPQFNRFVIKGTYKSSISSEIYLGAFNIPRGSVTITAGGQRLREGVDYTIDYNLGRVKIINDGIMNSGVPINVSYENNANFGFLTKTMIGNRFDYWVNDNLTIGGTHMFLSERPFTQKVNFGNDPIANNIYGVDVAYNKDLPGLTNFLDRLPIIKTQATSSIDFAAEGAYLRPGHSKAINQEEGSKGGIVYIDDFEGSRNTYDLRFPLWSWSLASTPGGAKDENGDLLFPEAALYDSLAYGYNRAKFIWYNLDPVFQANNSATPSYIKNNPSTQSNHYVRVIQEQEIFERDNPNQIFTQIATFDMAYFPSERGPYNYLASKDGITGISAGINEDGTLKAPATRWGGIQRSIEINDFEQANVEYIDFWVMDPFDNTHPYGNVSDDGYLYIDMGNISEDVMKDSRMFFENGLPRPSTSPRMDTTIWGRVPRTQVVVNAFDTDPDVLQLQDAGFDGFLSEDEQNHHQQFLAKVQTMVANGELTQAAADELLQDPSTDDFVAYLDESLANEAIGIIDRYKNYDGPEGNTAANTQNQQFSQGSNLPNSEDLNQDNTLSETESYFQYKIPVFTGMDVTNHPYITDVVTKTASFQDGTSDEISWYHFQIPIREFTERIGGIQDFRSIQFMRIFMTGFQNPMLMRFAQLQLVRNQWMRYRFSLQSPGEYIPNDNDDQTLFNVGAVSVEENSRKEPIPYVLPPGVRREEFVGNNAGNTFLQNEQSLLLEVCGLQDGDSRGVFKTLNFDFRQYERMQLFLHAEAYTGQQQSGTFLRNGELWAFVRLGDDFTQNYYEYALPLKVTNPDDVTGDELARRQATWPTENLIDVLLDSLREVKLSRNDQGLSRGTPYTVTLSNGHQITIVGNPNLGNVKVAMIGLRNPKDEGVIGPDLCAEIWANEFRLSGLDNEGGTAGVVRSDIRLADLGSVSLAGSFHTIGYGQIHQKVNERYRDNFTQLDASTNLELGKLMPENWGISLPMYAGISNSYSRPEFDPYDLDIPVEDKLARLSGAEEKEYLRQIQDFTSIRSLNFTNVRKNKTGGGKARPWDISNFNLTYAFSETYRSSPILEYDLLQRHKGGLAYQYNARTNYIEPFKNLLGNSKWLRLIRDFNFNPLPNRFSFRTELNRQYGETVLRDLYGDALLDTTFNKAFTWDRFYDVRWDITKSLKLDFNAANLARIDEPQGTINTEAEKDSVWENIYAGGRTTDYRHTITVNYNLPTNKFPLTDWINARAAYGASYEWKAASLVVDTLGNTLTNSRNIRLNADGNLSRLYDKVGFLKRANQRQRNTRRRNTGRIGGERAEGENQENKPKEENKESSSGMHPALRAGLRLVTALKRASVKYTRTEGTVLPGYAPDTDFLGMQRWTAPGWAFVTGFQPDTNTLDQYAANGWIVKAQTLPFQHTQNLQENFDMQLTLEPVPDMRIDLNWTQDYQNQFAEFFRYDPVTQRYVHQNPMNQGSYSITYGALNTLFDPVDTAGFSATYRVFEERRKEVSRLLGQRNPYSNGTFLQESPTDTLSYPQYSDGYGPYAVDVLIPAFLSSYTGMPIEEIGFDLFNLNPKPNWRFTYNGLARVAPFDKIFQNLNITHAYNSQLTINSYQTDYNYADSNNTGWPSARDTISGNFYPIFTVPQIMLSEQFAPLIGIDLTLQNGLTARFSYKKSRQVLLNLVDYQMIETKSTEITFGGGYRVKGVTLPFKIRGKQVTLENELNFTLDFSLRDDRTNNYVLDQNTSEPTQGALTYSLSPQVDYVINDRLNVRLFVDHRRTKPYTSASFPITNTNGGLAIRFTLAE